MTAQKEIKLGVFLWLVGISGCLWAALYITKHEGTVYLFFGSIFAMGLGLTWCGVFDLLCDEFEDEVKDSYEP